MTVEATLRAVRLGQTAERLAAAEELERVATQEHVATLETIVARELDHYVQASIERAVAAAKSRPSQRHSAVEPAAVGADLSTTAAVRASAIRETTARIVHELTRLVGAVGAEASDEISEFSTSRTNAAIERLLSLIEGVDRLSRAAAVPLNREFELGTVVRDVVAVEASRHATVEVIDEGPDSLTISSDPDLLRLILHNAVGNACEATESLQDKQVQQPVVVGWGKTDRDVWIAILDRGVGLSKSKNVFEFGQTSKSGHHGVGLALAKQAAESLGVDIALEPRQAGGAAFAIRLSTLDHLA